jgi:NOL1/NOP2/fmu family ribosome biogenesis protein
MEKAPVVHTIAKDVTPEHAEEIRLANQNSTISAWTIDELEKCITKAENDAGFHIRGNSLAADKAWAFVLFPENQERDTDRYPLNYDSETIKIRKDRFINSCRMIMTRIDQLEANNTPSKDINNDEFSLEFRVRRLIKDRQEMFEQYRIWELRYNRINNPTLAIDNTDSSLKDDESNTPYQKLLLFLLKKAYDNGYRRYRDQCCVQIRNTRAWRPVKEIKEFVYDSTQKEDEPEMWKNLTSRGTLVGDVVRHLTNCKDFQFAEIKKDRHTWSFQNGLLVGKDWNEAIQRHQIRFYGYDTAEFRALDPTLVSCKYFDLPFDPYDNIEDWWDIPTPNMQHVLDYQRFETDVCKWMYVFMGRLCFEVNEMDGWQVIPFLKGIAQSGKSTIITKVCRKFYECEDVATLSNNIEKKFGLQSIYKGFMFISPEIKGDLALEQAEFQSLVSGEDLSIARKNEMAISVQWKTPGILGGNEVPNWKDNSGSILRRLATWNFGRKIAEAVADPHLDEKLEKEIPAIMCKCLRAYLDYSHKYADKDIWNVLPKYFKTIQNQVATVTNSLQHFLCSEKFRFGSDLFVPQKVFVAQFNQHCRDNNLGSFKFNQDFYAGPFSARELEVRVESRIYNGNAYSTQPFIFGLDFVTQE